MRLSNYPALCRSFWQKICCTARLYVGSEIRGRKAFRSRFVHADAVAEAMRLGVRLSVTGQRNSGMRH